MKMRMMLVIVFTAENVFIITLSVMIIGAIPYL